VNQDPDRTTLTVSIAVTTDELAMLTERARRVEHTPDGMLQMILSFALDDLFRAFPVPAPIARAVAPAAPVDPPSYGAPVGPC